MSRSRLTVILYSAACADRASAASDAPAIAVRAVMPTIPKRRRIAYSLAVSNPSPGAQLAFARRRRLGADITRPQSPRKGGVIACWPGGPPVLGGPNPMAWHSPRLDIGGLYHLCPRGELRPDPLAEFLRRARDHVVAERSLALFHLGCRQALDDLAVEERDHLLRGAGRHHESHEAITCDVGIAAFRHGRHIGQRLRTHLAGDRQCSHLSVIDQRHCDRRGAHADGRMA